MKSILLSFVIIFILAIFSKSLSEPCPTALCSSIQWEITESTLTFSIGGCNIIMHYVKRSGYCSELVPPGEIYEFQILYFGMDPIMACSTFSSEDCLYIGQLELLKHSRSIFNPLSSSYDVTIYKNACWYQSENQGNYYLVRPCPSENPCCSKKYSISPYKPTHSTKQRITQVVTYADNLNFICPQPNPYEDLCSNKCNIGRVVDEKWEPELLMSGVDLNREMKLNDIVSYLDNELKIKFIQQNKNQKSIKITNIIGEVIFETHTSNSNEYSIILPENLFVSGIYFVIVEISNAISIKEKIMVY